MRDVPTKLELVAMVLVVLAALAIGIAWQVYAFRDCKKVGHSTLYCLVRGGSR